ncbi:hypothetical protein CHH57_20890 [Niallia circulans]|uniref:DUF2809 domain-containing protein n=1 Tax=Niallia circulans TaxID=1397 RepID=A0AA91YZ57_NIACI|nr:DUF2809 domain-containing protein [Niallia circulans]PAD81263.1 hypothetical protein CHH57_20890 [Niallia circulans]
MYRLFYFVITILMMLLGLSSRKFSNHLPDFIAVHAGDMIWAMMVYFGFRFLFIRKSLLLAGVLSILFSFGIEGSQLYQADWLNQLRDTTIGAVILGKGFLFMDLIRYSSGILLACIVDTFFVWRSKRD